MNDKIEKPDFTKRSGLQGIKTPQELFKALDCCFNTSNGKTCGCFECPYTDSCKSHDGSLTDTPFYRDVRVLLGRFEPKATIGRVGGYMQPVYNEHCPVCDAYVSTDDCYDFKRDFPQGAGKYCYRCGQALKYADEAPVNVTPTETIGDPFENFK